jgi:hypothetical protein
LICEGAAAQDSKVSESCFTRNIPDSLFLSADLAGTGEDPTMETYFAQASMLDRLRSGPIGPYLPGFVTALEQRCYSRDTIRRCLRGADSLGRWLDGQNVALVEANQSHPGAPVQGRRLALGLSGRALISRAPHDETIRQSKAATNARNIQELGISTGIPLTAYQLDVPTTPGTYKRKRAPRPGD